MKNTVFVVDDDAAVRESLCALIEDAGFRVEPFGSAEHFLAAHDSDRSGCLLLDVRMPGMDGLELQHRLNARGSPLVVIIITGHADVPMAIKAMKNGAVDFVEKPFDPEHLLASIQSALQRNNESQAVAAERERARDGLARLTVREREVFDLIVVGWTNRMAARELGISQKTVEAHRAAAMHKMEARTLAELVRFATIAEQPEQ